MSGAYDDSHIPRMPFNDTVAGCSNKRSTYCGLWWFIVQFYISVRINRENNIMLLEVILRTVFRGVLCINKFNYLSSGIPASVSRSFGLISAMGFIPDAGVYPVDTFFVALRALLHSDVGFIGAECKAIYDPTDFYERPFVASINGQDSGESSPPFVAYGFRTSRVRGDIARGTRRFVGVADGKIGSGGALVPGALTAVENLADVMDNNLEYDDEGNTLTYAPVIVHKEKYQSNSDPVRWAYRYYASEATQLTWLAQGFIWQPYLEARSQTSRQYGRGM